ncbi:MAG: hypothetical protein ACREFW_04570 [Rhizomicrobium sp.]
MAKGKKTGGGSRKGVPNKLTRALKDLVLAALADAGGQAYLARQADENPTAFMGLLGKLLPRELAGDAERPLITRIERVIIEPHGSSGHG